MMSVRYCPKCGSTISESEANFCPHCVSNPRKTAEVSEKVYCIKCGKESPITYKFCPNCGHPLVKPKPPKSSQAPKTPISIMIAAIFCIVIGCLNILPSIAGILAGTFMHSIGIGMTSMIPSLEVLGIPAQMIGGVLVFIGSLFAVFAALYILAGILLYD